MRYKKIRGRVAHTVRCSPAVGCCSCVEMLRRHDESPEDFSAGIDKLYGIDVRGKNPPALDVGRLR